MGVAILAIIGIGLLASLSPSTLVVFILILLTTVRPRSNALGFFFGWTVSLIFVFCLVYAVDGTASRPHSNGGTASDVAEIVLGLVLGYVGMRSWQRRHVTRPPAARMLRLEARLKNLRPWQAAALGIVEQPWTLTAAAAIVIVHHNIGPLTTLLAFILFTVFSTASVLAIFTYYTRHPDSTEPLLIQLRLRLAQAGPRSWPLFRLS